MQPLFVQLVRDLFPLAAVGLALSLGVVLGVSAT